MNLEECLYKQPTADDLNLEIKQYINAFFAVFLYFPPSPFRPLELEMAGQCCVPS